MYVTLEIGLVKTIKQGKAQNLILAEILHAKDCWAPFTSSISGKKQQEKLHINQRTRTHAIPSNRENPRSALTGQTKMTISMHYTSGSLPCRPRKKPSPQMYLRPIRYVFMLLQMQSMFAVLKMFAWKVIWLAGQPFPLYCHLKKKFCVWVFV